MKYKYDFLGPVQMWKEHWKWCFIAQGDYFKQDGNQI